MIRLTRLNHVPLVLNADLIEHVEVTPDTVVSLTTGQKFIVLETAEELIERVIAYRRAIERECPWRDASTSGQGPGSTGEEGREVETA
jgi:flagellar protein FlbD